MSVYRLYFSDREGHFCGVRGIEAQDDAKAMGRADRMCPGLRRELWRGDSLLKRWGDGNGDLSEDIRQTG